MADTGGEATCRWRVGQLRPHVRKLCFGLLGPPPDHLIYEEYCRVNGKTLPPTVEQREQPTKVAKKKKPETADPVVAGLSPLTYAADAKRKNKRQLLCMLRDARRKLAHHGKRSFSGKEAKKEMAVAEAELTRRAIAIPPAGQETAAWDKKAG